MLASLPSLLASLHSTLSSTTSTPKCSPSEMRSRRLRNSVRREQYYGSVELVVSVDPRGRIKNIGRFRLEPSSDCIMDGPPVSTSNSIVLENPQEEMRWYWKHFLGNEHQIFCGCDPLTRDPIFLSIVIEEEIDDNKLCRAILWTSKGPRRMCIPIPPGGKELSVKTVIQRFPGFSDFNRSLTPVTNPKIQKELCLLEDQEGSVNCKFGVIYAKKGQNTDAQMLSNEQGNEAFERFLKVLGQRIDLQGWGSFRGGLDTTTNSTGRESVYTVFGGHEIMFHVSTMLPHSKENDQQIERKRHVGNDIVNVIFEATDDPLHLNFSPTMMKSHFTHVFAVVTFCERTGVWRLWVFSEDSVPAFGPSIPHPNMFTDTARFREFLLTKLINAEKAAHNASAFVEKRHRTNDTLLKDMYIEYLKGCVKGNINRVTDAVIKHIRSPIRKEAPKDAIDFCKFGELIKLEKMLSGEVVDAVKMNVCRRQPWDKEIVLRNMPSHDVIGSDMWGQDALLIATEEHGVIYLSNDKNLPIFDAACKVQDIMVNEAFDLCFIRADKGKDGYAAVFSLSELRNALTTQVPIQKRIAQAHKIQGTKGCHLFTTIDDRMTLKVVVAMGKKISLLRWTKSTLKKYVPGEVLADHFTLVASQTVSEEPVAMCAYEKRIITPVVKAVVLSRAHLFVYDLKDGTEEILAWDVPRSSSSIILKAASDGESDEFAMLYQNSTLLFDRNDGRWNWEQTFWSTNLKQFAFRFPFIIGFGEDLIEIRLVVNGNLLASMYMPSVRLLSLKQDIYFSVERAFSSSTPVNSGNTRSSLIRRDRHQADNKRWDIYRFKGSRLEMAGSDECSSTVAVSLGGAFTPQVFRRTDEPNEEQPALNPEANNNNHEAALLNEKMKNR